MYIHSTCTYVTASINVVGKGVVGEKSPYILSKQLIIKI